jgi:hypothetical protein
MLDGDRSWAFVQLDPCVVGVASPPSSPAICVTTAFRERATKKADTILHAHVHELPRHVICAASAPLAVFVDCTTDFLSAVQSAACTAITDEGDIVVSLGLVDEASGFAAAIVRQRWPLRQVLRVQDSDDDDDDDVTAAEGQESTTTATRRLAGMLEVPPSSLCRGSGKTTAKDVVLQIDISVDEAPAASAAGSDGAAPSAKRHIATLRSAPFAVTLT